MVKRTSVLLASLLTAVTVLSSQERRRFPESLRLVDAVEIALQAHPSLKVAEAGVQSAASGVTSAWAAFLPQVSGVASGTHTDGAFVFNPSIPSRVQTYDSYNTTLNVQQTVYDFGRSSGRLSSARILEEASLADYQSAHDNVIANVSIAYYTVLQTQRVVEVNLETLAQAEAHLQQAKGYFSVGTKPQFDVTKAQVDVANANVNVISARNQLRIARLQLENAMGVHADAPYGLSDTLGMPKFWVSLDSALAVALDSRPDVRSSKSRVESNRAAVSSTWSQHLPAISLTGVWSWNGFDFPLQSRWNAGVAVSVPLFQGFAISAQVDQAEAALNSSEAGYHLTVENARLDVEQSYYSHAESAERIDATSKLIQQAVENLKLAVSRYNFGAGSAIEITDAQASLAGARLSNIQALVDYNTSLVRLKRAMGILSR